MIDIKHQKCIVCKKKIPCFNISGETVATHCKECSLPDMIDIVNKKCVICNKRSHYGIPCNQPTACASHKTEGMICNPRAKCRKKNCKNIAIHGIKSPIHCDLHKNDNDINLVERHCDKCGKLDILVNGICLNFCMLDEKYNDYKKNQKVKEKRVLNILTSQIGPPTEYNIKIPRDCGQHIE